MNWPQLAYQYIVGGLFFGITLFLCSRAGSGSSHSQRRAIKISIAGLAGYFLFHVAWIAIASE